MTFDRPPRLHRDEVVAALREAGPASVSELSHALGRRWTAPVRGHLMRMLREGAVARIGTGTVDDPFRYFLP